MVLVKIVRMMMAINYYEKTANYCNYLFSDGSKAFAGMLCSHVKCVNFGLEAGSNEFVHLDVFTIKLQTTHLYTP